MGASDSYTGNLAQEMRDLRSKYDASIAAIGNRIVLPGEDRQSTAGKLLITERGRAGIEALLIVATEDCFVSDTLKRDIVLMAFGLLKGYSQHGSLAALTEVSDRYDKFIKESTYIHLTASIEYGSYEEAERAGRGTLKTIRDTLGTKAGRYINEVAKHLEKLKSEALKELIAVASQKYGSSYRDRITDDELPSLLNIKEEAAVHIPTLHLLPIPADIYGRETYGCTISSSDSVWGDSSNGGRRRGYTVEQAKAGLLGDSVVFNSIYDGRLNGGYGFDERNFISIRNIPDIPHAKSGEWHIKEIAAKNGSEYEVCCYVHNNNPGGHSVEAKDTKVLVMIPKESSCTTGSIMIKGCIQSSNAEPSMYWSSVRIIGDQRSFTLEYIPGSARLHNSGIGSSVGGLPLDDSIVTGEAENGILIGYDALNGVIPGGSRYASYITMRVKVKDFIKHEVIGRVRTVGSRKWEKCITDVAVGDKLEFQFEFRNNSTFGEIMENIVLKIEPLVNMRYVVGSARLWTADCPGIRIDPHGELIGGGVNIGDYAPGANAIVRFAVEVVDSCMESARMGDACWAQVQNGNASVAACASVEYQTVRIATKSDASDV